MGRLEKFKHKRNLRQRYTLAVLLFFSLLTVGILTVDYSTNYLLTGRQGIHAIALNNKTSYLEIVFMNQKMYINTRYIQRDLNKLKNDLHEFLTFPS